MTKFLAVVAAVAALVAFGNVPLVVPHVPNALYVMPAIGVIFLAGLYYVQR